MIFQPSKQAEILEAPLFDTLLSGFYFLTGEFFSGACWEEQSVYLYTIAPHSVVSVDRPYAGSGYMQQIAKGPVG
jgi:hypothetical protein